MTDQDADLTSMQAPPNEPARKVWSKPVLTIRSIEDVTHGSKASTRTDNVNDNFIS